MKRDWWLFAKVYGFILGVLLYELLNREPTRLGSIGAGALVVFIVTMVQKGRDNRTPPAHPPGTPYGAMCDYCEVVVVWKKLPSDPNVCEKCKKRRGPRY